MRASLESPNDDRRAPCAVKTRRDDAVGRLRVIITAYGRVVRLLDGRAPVHRVSRQTASNSRNQARVDVSSNVSPRMFTHMLTVSALRLVGDDGDSARVLSVRRYWFSTTSGKVLAGGAGTALCYARVSIPRLSASLPESSLHAGNASIPACARILALQYKSLSLSGTCACMERRADELGDFIEFSAAETRREHGIGTAAGLSEPVFHMRENPKRSRAGRRSRLKDDYSKCAVSHGARAGRRWLRSRSHPRKRSVRFCM